MIALFTDFGLRNPYVGQMHAVIAAANPSLPVIDLFHHAPKYDVKRSAYMLKALAATLPPRAVVVGVVDPGVGSQRKAIAVSVNKQWFIGPDNGLFSLLVDEGETSRVYEILDTAPLPSNTFHGRDVFAPAAVQVAAGKLDAVLPSTETDRSITRDFALLWPKNLPEIIFIDDFGNATTGIVASRDMRKQMLQANYAVLPYKRTFSRTQQGQAFWTINSLGLIEIAANQANAAALLTLTVGDKVELT